MSKKSELAAQQEEARAHLLALLPPGSRVMCVLRHVSRSGMLREIDFYAFKPDGRRWLSYSIGRLLGYSMGKRDALRVSGCGMDMGFSVVYNLSRTLYPEGFSCIGEHVDSQPSCPSNDHSNGDRDYTPHMHRDGGYALLSEWL